MSSDNVPHSPIRNAINTARDRVVAMRRESELLQNRRAHTVNELRREADLLATGRAPSLTSDFFHNWPTTTAAVVTANFGTNRERALDTLTRVATVAQNTRDTAGETTNRRVLAWCDELATQDEAGDALANDILSNDGAVQSFLTLTDEGQSLVDSEWDAAVSRVRSTFGDDVAVAVMRGRFTAPPIAAPTPQSPSRPQDVAPPPVNIPEPTISDNLDAVRRASGTGFAAASTPSPQPPPIPESEPLAPTTVGDQTTEPQQLPEETWFSGLARDLAAAKPGQATPKSVDAWTFLDRGEYGLAYHMAADANPSTRAVLALWAVSRRLVHPHGTLARMTADLIDQIDPRQLDHEEMLLLRAALMRPALVAPETKAGSLLRALPRSPHRTRLDNISLRTATAGERLGGLLTHEFKTVSKDDLKAGLEAWLDRVNERISYVADRPLYLRTHWSVRTPEHRGQEAAIERWRSQRSLEQLASRVVRPLVSDGPDRWRMVRLETERVDQLLETGDVPAGERGMLAEGVALARQYGISAAEGRVGGGFVPTEVSTLASELRTRRDLINEDLVGFALGGETDRADTATRLFGIAVDDLQQLVDPTIAVFPQEPEPNQVLHGELLKVPSIPTDDQWRPTAAPADVTRQLQQYAAQQPVTWNQAYLAHARIGNKLACDRVMQSAEWTPSERRRMRQQRDEVLSTNGRSILADIDEVASLVDEAVRLQILDEATGAAFHQRYQQIRSTDSHPADIDAFARDARQLRNRLEQQRGQRLAHLRDRENAIGQRSAARPATAPNATGNVTNNDSDSAGPSTQPPSVSVFDD